MQVPGSKKFRAGVAGREAVGWTKDRKGKRVHEMLVS